MTEPNDSLTCPLSSRSGSAGRNCAPKPQPRQNWPPRHSKAHLSRRPSEQQSSTPTLCRPNLGMCQLCASYACLSTLSCSLPLSLSDWLPVLPKHLRFPGPVIMIMATLAAHCKRVNCNGKNRGGSPFISLSLDRLLSSCCCQCLQAEPKRPQLAHRTPPATLALPLVERRSGLGSRKWNCYLWRSTFFITPLTCCGHWIWIPQTKQSLKYSRAYTYTHTKVNFFFYRQSTLHVQFHPLQCHQLRRHHQLHHHHRQQSS